MAKATTEKSSAKTSSRKPSARTSSGRPPGKASSGKPSGKVSSGKPSSKASPKKSSTTRTPKKTKIDRLKDAALSPEMLGAAGLAATGAAIASSSKARRAIYEAGVDVADAAGDAANQLRNNAARLSALIGEAVADAVLRALSGNWPTDSDGIGKRKSPTGVGKSRTGNKQG